MDHSKACTLLAVVTLAGGLMAYLRKNSVPSLVGSAVLSMFFLASASVAIEPYGRKLAVIGSLGLTAVMFGRALKTRNTVPIVGLGVGAAASAYFAFASK